MNEVYLAGTGSYLPERVLTNAELERLVDTTDEWIVQRTGIKERRIAAGDQATSDLALRAARAALDDAVVSPEALDGIILASITPDTYVPAAAVYIQEALGARQAAAFDLNAACTGFIYAVATGSSLIRSGIWKTALVLGAESLSRIVDYTDRNSCILFGDGAGAGVLTGSPPAGVRGHKLLDSYLRSDGSMAQFIALAAGGSRRPASAETVAAKEHYLRMNGKEVFKFATRALVELIEIATERNGMRVQDIDLLVPHQVNYRIIESAQKKLDLPLDRFFLNLERYGNTSAASVPIALDEAARAGRLRPGNKVLLVAFGAGMTWGYNLLEW